MHTTRRISQTITCIMVGN